MNFLGISVTLDVFPCTQCGEYSFSHIPVREREGERNEQQENGFEWVGDGYTLKNEGNVNLSCQFLLSQYLY